MRRVGIILGFAALLAALPGASALGATKNVTANTTFPMGVENDFFDPKTVTIAIGDTVHWHNNSGKHNVHLGFNNRRIGGDPLTHSSTSTHWDADWKFNSAGTFKYWCDEHSDGNVGMIGKVVVKNPNDHTPPKVTNLRAKPSSFCTNKSQTCDKRGTKIKFTLSEAAKVSGQIKRKGTAKPFKTIFSGKQKPAGKSSINYSGKDLKPGKYVLRVRGRDAAGNTGKYAQTTVTVVKNG